MTRNRTPYGPINPDDYHSSIFLGFGRVYEPDGWQWQPIAIHPGAGTMREHGNLVIIGPPGAGKTALMRNNNETWLHSLVNVDLKGTLYQQTAARRAEIGRVYVLDVRTGTGNRYNPVANIRRDQWRELADELVSLTNDDVFWKGVAIDMWLACWSAAEHAGRPHIPYAVEIMAMGFGEAMQYMVKAHRDDPQTMKHLADFNGRVPTLEWAGKLIEQGPSKLLESKWATVTNTRAPLDDPILLNVFSGNDIDVPGMFYDDGIATIYVQADETKPRLFAAFARLVMKTIGDTLIAEGDREGVRRRPVLFFFDEFGTIRLNSAVQWLNTMRSRDVVLVMMVQEFDHLAPFDKTFDENSKNSFHHMLLFKPVDPSGRIAKKISALSGQQSIIVETSGESYGESYSESVSRTVRERNIIEQEQIENWQMNQGYSVVTARQTIKAVTTVPRMYSVYPEWPSRAETQPPRPLLPYVSPLIVSALPEPTAAREQTAQAAAVLDAVTERSEQAERLARLEMLRRAQSGH